MEKEWLAEKFSVQSRVKSREISNGVIDTGAGSSTELFRFIPLVHATCISLTTNVYDCLDQA